MSHTARNSYRLTESYPCALSSDNAHVRLAQNFPPHPKEREGDLKQARAFHLLWQPLKTADKCSWNAGGLPPSSKQLCQPSKRQERHCSYLFWFRHVWLAELYCGCLGFFLGWGNLLHRDSQTPFSLLLQHIQLITNRGSLWQSYGQ